MKIMQYIMSDNIDESIDFYKKIGFSIYSDYLDGDKNRNVEMSIFKNCQVTIKFKPARTGCNEKRLTSKNPVFSLLVEDAYDYVSGVDVIFDRKLNPLENVFYCRDPYGNEICITEDDFF